MVSSVVSLEEARRVRLVAKRAHEPRHGDITRNPMGGSGRVAQRGELPAFGGETWIALGCLPTGGVSAQANVNIGARILGWPKGKAFDSVEGDREEGGSLDPERVALELCRELEALCQDGNRWVEIETLVGRTRLSHEVVVAAAVYGHVRGWVTYAVHSVMLRESGRSILRTPRS